MIAKADYRFLSELLQDQSGLCLGEGKEYLVQSRLLPLAQRLGLADVGELCRRLRQTADLSLVAAIGEAMATHESLFFRDGTPFQLLRERIIPELIARRAAERRLRIWSAGASTGQEAYSIAMLLEDFAGALHGWSVDILGTDYSAAAVARARVGLYTHFEVQRGLPPLLRQRYFASEGAAWRLNDQIRRKVRFQQANLLRPFGERGPFDVVFCRNVLIYFDVPTKRGVLERLAQVLAPDGYLFLGSSETATGVTERLARADTQTSVYRLSRPAAASHAS